MVGKVIALLLLIAALAAGGIFWFDHLHLIDARSVLAPVYGLFGREGRSQPAVPADGVLSLDAERFEIRLEALALREMELDARERDLEASLVQAEMISQELDQRERLLDDLESSLAALSADALDRRRNVEQVARYLSGMPPASAVGIISEMGYQDAVDVLRMAERIAQAEGTGSLVPVWFMTMEPARAAEIQRRMVTSPQSL